MATLSARQRASLAARLRRGRPRGAAPGPGGPVPLNDGRADRNLVLFHPIGGTVFPYGHLAGGLADRFAVWGIPALSTHPAGLEEMVTGHLETVRAAWPDGPYRLGGWSMGGVLAFEVARRLQGDGAEIETLALLDTPAWLPSIRHATEAEFTAWFVADAARSLRADAGWPPDPYTTGVDQQLAWLAKAMDTTGDPEQLREELVARCTVFCENTRLLAGYRPSGPLRARALVVDVEESPNGSQTWRDLIDGPVRVVPLPGNHYSFLQPPLVNRLATELLDLDEKEHR